MKETLRGILMTILPVLLVTTVVRSVLTIGIFGKIEQFLPRTDYQLLILIITLCFVCVFQIVTKSFMFYGKFGLWPLFLSMFSGALISGYLIGPGENRETVVYISVEVLIISMWALSVLNASTFLRGPLPKSKVRVLAILLSAGVLFLLGLSNYHQKLLETYAYAHPKIISYEPKLVSTRDKVILRGTGFGEKVNDQYKVVYGSGKELKVDSWDENKIIIEMSTLDNSAQIKVVRPSEYGGKLEERESNGVTLELYRLDESTPELQRRYFYQLQNMSNEAKKLYGISSF